MPGKVLKYPRLRLISVTLAPGAAPVVMVTEVWCEGGGPIEEAGPP